MKRQFEVLTASVHSTVGDLLSVLVEALASEELHVRDPLVLLHGDNPEPYPLHFHIMTSEHGERRLLLGHAALPLGVDDFVNIELDEHEVTSEERKLFAIGQAKERMSALVNRGFQVEVSADTSEGYDMGAWLPEILFLPRGELVPVTLTSLISRVGVAAVRDARHIIKGESDTPNGLTPGGTVLKHQHNHNFHYLMDDLALRQVVPDVEAIEILEAYMVRAIKDNTAYHGIGASLAAALDQLEAQLP